MPVYQSNDSSILKKSGGGGIAHSGLFFTDQRERESGGTGIKF
jgi:hypothetical protein